MNEINIPHEQRAALQAIAVDALEKRIEECLYERRLGVLRGLELDRCGPYVWSKLKEYERTLGEYAKAKSTKKLGESEREARRAGDELAWSVESMKRRVATEEVEDQVFHIEDRVLPPFQFSERLVVPVSYRWRSATGDDWTHGSITFIHDAELPVSPRTSTSKRKPSAARQECGRQDALRRDWEHLTRLALRSLKDYFRTGACAADVPRTFHVKTDPHSRRLNNFSAQFWV